MNPAALFRHRVYILEPVRERGATGQERIVRWATWGSSWADVVPQRAREFSALAQHHQAMTALYRIRGPLPLTMDHRLMHDGRHLAIVGMETEDNRQPASARIITVACRELP
jgi:head-tail adaptor